MGRELEDVLRQQVAQPASSCVSGSDVSFLDQVIRPLYEVISAVCPRILNYFDFSCLKYVVVITLGLEIYFGYLYSSMIT